MRAARLAERTAANVAPASTNVPPAVASEAIVGGSPYNRTQGELDAFFDRLERFLAFATRELGAIPATLAEFRRAYAG